jgi:hypothetical protein
MHNVLYKDCYFKKLYPSAKPAELLPVFSPCLALCSVLASLIFSKNKEYEVDCVGIYSIIGLYICSS